MSRGQKLDREEKNPDLVKRFSLCLGQGWVANHIALPP